VNETAIMEKPTIQPTAASKQSRQLAAVMFADMTGYTAMMQEDEAHAKILRDRQRQVLTSLIPAHNGKILQYFGDGTLSIFSSAIDAVKSAIAIQTELQKEPKVKLRIGIHSGDVAYDDEGVYGDCVNLASRIEALAVPGAVLISDKVHDEVKNQKEIVTVSLGTANLKNVKRPVEVFAIANEGLTVPAQIQADLKNKAGRSIAVLPFVNMSNDPENEYFSDGISEEILNALTHVEGLQVTARSSSFSFKGKNEDIRQIGSKLGVSSVLEGSVRKAGNKIRINVQLVNSTDGYRIWSEVYDRELEDIFRLQDEIAGKIVTRLKENFEPGKIKEAIIKPPTENTEAYNLYLKGRYYWNKSNPEDAKKAISTYEEAIQLDPKFALPYCALSYCYSYIGSAGLMSPTEAFPKAKDCTLKAIELNPDHAESHLSLASIKFFHNWDFEGTEQSLKKAQQLGLNSSMFYQVYGWFLIATGELEQAIEKMQMALTLDPLSLPLMCNLGDAYCLAGKTDEAIEQFSRVIELEPTFRRAFESRGMAYMVVGDYEKAIQDLEKYHQLVGHPLKGLSALGHAYAAAGYIDKANECLEKIALRQEKEPGVPLHMDFAFLYTGLKDFDKAFHFMNKTYENRMGIACMGMIFCIRFPMLRELRSDPRYNELLLKMGLKK
jgi:adenylate cyclase